VSADRAGVGELVRIGVERGRKTRLKLKVAMCGEHRGGTAAVAFCHQVGLDYVSANRLGAPMAAQTPGFWQSRGA
jgi:pyruvate, orthophosphate dikinase